MSREDRASASEGVVTALLMLVFAVVIFPALFGVAAAVAVWAFRNLTGL
jgi:hypothetical protein